MRGVPGDRRSGAVSRPVLNGAIIAACAAGYALNRLILVELSPFFRDHFSDLLAGAMILAWANLIAPAGSGAARFVGSLGGAALIIAFAGAVWEFAAPQVLPASTGDPRDLIAYAVGAILYLGFARLPPRARPGVRRDRAPVIAMRDV